MIEAEQRALVVAEARRWIGTPYHHAADVRGAGVDCGMLIVRVFVDTGLCVPFDPRPYAQDWHLHRNDERYLGFVFDRCCEIEEPNLGDIIVFRYGRCYSHGGIVTRLRPLSFIHAHLPARCVLEEGLVECIDLAHPARRRKFFSYWKSSQL
jgi:cell wall-associated NlpC family hydrolase